MRGYLVMLLSKWIGPVANYLVPNYVVMLAFGFFVSSLVFIDEGNERGHDTRSLLALLMLSYVGGFVGAATVPLIQGIATYFEEGRFRIPSGLAAYGGMIGGVITASLVLRLKHQKILPILDAEAPSLALGYSFARIGCLLAGCDWGQPTSLPFALRYAPGSHTFRDHVARGYIDAHAASSLAVHPTQIYSSLLGFVLFLVLRKVDRVPHRTSVVPGRRFALFVIGYAVGRSLIETVRGDASRGRVAFLSTSQFIALSTCIIVASVAFYLKRKSSTHSQGQR